jgi:acetoin utilization deacetylase AcuC-like enzyme
VKGVHRTVSSVRLWDTSEFTFPLPPGHPFPGRKYRALRQLLERAELGRLLCAPAPVDLGAVLAVHEAGYVQRFLQGQWSDREQKRVGLPWSVELLARVLHSVGGTVAAVQDALERGIGVNLAGGAHHAHREFGRGFCVWNDLAVAAFHARERGVDRVLVVDCDVHQGDGTASIFARDPGACTLSVHGATNFPHPKVAGDLDVALWDGAGDADYLRALYAALRRALEEFRPQLALYVAGVDPYFRDRLGRLALTAAGLRARDRMVLGIFRERRVPVAITLGGGYTEPVGIAARLHAQTVRVAVDVFARR